MMLPFEDIPQKYLNLLKENIISCEFDQPYDSEDDEYIFIGNNHTEFSELLYDLKVPEKYHDMLYGRFCCPFCGNELYSDSRVELHETDDKLRETDVNRVLKTTEAKIKDFESFITKYPYLGLEHSVGKRISKEIVSVPTLCIENQDWYRARNVDCSDIFSVKDMGNPDPEKVEVKEGRYSHFGQSFLYLADSPYVCYDEIKSNRNSFCWMQKIRVKKLRAVLDLTKPDIQNPNLPLYVKGLLYTGVVNKASNHASSWKPEYIIPRFIADLCRRNKIDAILYDSSLSKGKCLTIFNPIDAEIEYCGRPYFFSEEYESMVFKPLPF